MPALPRVLFEKYTKVFGLSSYDAYNLTDSKGIALYYEELIAFTSNYKAAANWMMGDVKSYLNEFGVEIDQFPITPQRLSGLISLIEQGKVSTSMASQRIFPEMLISKGEAIQIAEQLNLIQDSSEDSLKAFISEVFKSHPNEVERFKNGEKQLTGFFMGQLMKVSKGKADPKTSNSLLRQMLEEL
jgi:aspartyl-tRNA(Asn)/glutamyl-tRNA(Gln) amidotransferase subunit B